MARLLADWRASKQRMDLIIKKLPRMVGHEAVAVVKENFLLQGYDDGRSFKMWPSREPSTNKRYDKRYGVKGSVFSSSNPVLHQTGDLENSLDYKVVNEKTVFIGSNLAVIPYAKIHNEGGRGTAYGHPFVMKQRKYMPLPGDPPNQKILRAIQEKLKYETAQAMKTFAK